MTELVLRPNTSYDEGLHINVRLHHNRTLAPLVYWARAAALDPLNNSELRTNLRLVLRLLLHLRLSVIPELAVIIFARLLMYADILDVHLHNFHNLIFIEINQKSAVVLILLFNKVAEFHKLVH